MILDIPDVTVFLNEMNSAHDDMDGSFKPEVMDVLTKYEKSPNEASMEAASERAAVDDLPKP